MCTRFEYAPRGSHLISIEEQFGRTVREELSEFPANLNARPAQRIPIIRWLTKEQPSVVSARWGFIPKSATSNEVDLAFQTDVKLAQTDVRWRYAWRYARCLIPATAWYEATAAAKDSKRKDPTDNLSDETFPPSLKVAAAGGQIMMLAGLHGFLTTEHGHRDTVSVVTHLIPKDVDRVEQQVPCVVVREAWNTWLSPTATDPNRILDYLEKSGPRPGVSMII